MSGLGTETRLYNAQSSQIAYWGMDVQSVLLLRIWNRWSRSETPYISALLGSKFYRLICLFLLIRIQLKLQPRGEFNKEASQFQYRCWEERNITVRPALTYIYFVAMVCSLFIVFFKLSFYNSARLNWKVRQAWKYLWTIGNLSNKHSWCLVPFISNISCDCPQRISVLATISTRGPYISERYCAVIF